MGPRRAESAAKAKGRDPRDPVGCGAAATCYNRGRLGEFYVHSGKAPYAETVDAALRDLPQRVENTACASAEGLDHRGDVVHFGADALRELGKRYAAEMSRSTKP